MTSFASHLRLSDLRSFCMKNIYNNVFHLKKLPGYYISVPALCSSRAFCAIGRVKITRCVVILMLCLFLPGCSMMTYLHAELLQFLSLALLSRRSFCERRNPFNNTDLLSGTDVIQSESSENLCLSLKYRPFSNE